jgi:hypothetical protein
VDAKKTRDTSNAFTALIADTFSAATTTDTMIGIGKNFKKTLDNRLELWDD